MHPGRYAAAETRQPELRKQQEKLDQPDLRRGSAGLARRLRCTLCFRSSHAPSFMPPARGLQPAVHASRNAIAISGETESGSPFSSRPPDFRPAHVSSAAPHLCEYAVVNGTTSTTVIMPRSSWARM